MVATLGTYMKTEEADQVSESPRGPAPVQKRKETPIGDFVKAEKRLRDLLKTVETHQASYNNLQIDD